MTSVIVISKTYEHYILDGGIKAEYTMMSTITDLSLILTVSPYMEQF